jgi:hypothetical protein
MTFTFTGPVTFPIEVTELLAELLKIRNIIVLTRKDIMATLQELNDALAAQQVLIDANLAVGNRAIDALNALAAKVAEMIAGATELTELKAGLQVALDDVNADAAVLSDETSRIQASLDAVAPPAPPV